MNRINIVIGLGRPWIEEEAMESGTGMFQCVFIGFMLVCVFHIVWL